MKKHVPSFEDFLNEGYRFKGKDLYPEWVQAKDIAGGIRNVRDITQGSSYVILEPGMDVWQAEWEYQGKKGGKHIFVSSVQFSDVEPLEYTDAELKDAVKNAEIFLMK